MEPGQQNWELYERMIAHLVADQAATDLCVTPNARIIGSISGRSRQIDVLIEMRHDADLAKIANATTDTDTQRRLRRLLGEAQ
jgi:hypothetical protein